MFGDMSQDLQLWLNNEVKRSIGRDMSYAFYDVTNFFFDIDFPDDEGGSGGSCGFYGYGSRV